LSQSANGELGVVTLTKTLTTYTGNTPQTGDLYGAMTSAQAEPSGAPTVNASPLTKLARLYQVVRNKLTVSATAKTLYDDAGGALWSKALADDGTTYTEDEGA
jgi:hypothetical protein